MSKAVLNQFAQLKTGKDNFKRYRYWIDTEKFKPMLKKEARNKIGINNGFTVLFAGRLIPIKGVNLLAAIARELEYIQFIFIGNGPLENTLKHSSNQFSNLHFLGQIQNSNMPVYYSSADIFCIPSLYEEGLGRVAMEAVSCGTPVIGSKRGGIPEALDDKISILVEPTHESIRRSIELLYEDEDRLKRMRSFCRKYALEHYSKRNADLITKYY
jgi:glycosyltransferase involved in cell wall biosynthesis